jgi:hypothetical protein
MSFIAAGLDAVADVAEQTLDVAAEEQDGDDAEDRDETEDEAVLGETLAVFVGDDGTKGGDHESSP